MQSFLLKNEERAVFSLRSLYRQYGYLPYKMSKFEEYEYYIRNKDFLTGDRFITFTDTTGRLLALKPDVTLSIVKNLDVKPGCKQKVYYDENVYRISDSTGQYKEIMQAGLECIGDIDSYDLYEVVSLAARSLGLISEDFVLQISHLGVLSAVMREISTDQTFQKMAANYIASKNLHDLIRLCSQYGIPGEKVELLVTFINLYGDREYVLTQMEAVLGEYASDSLRELRCLSEQLDQLPCSDKIVFDFSVVNNMSYYNGIVFSGFLRGINDRILAGGQYDKLMRKLHFQSGAVGFAVYLDLLEQLPNRNTAWDVDVLLLYSGDMAADTVAKGVEKWIAAGKTVSAQRCIPPDLRYGEIIYL